MTNEELFTDLKQFIEATMSQQTAHLATKDDLDSKIEDLERRLTAKIDNLEEKLDTVQDAIADTVQDHEQRLHRLEKRAA